ncbi:MAG TPA: DUF3307 domain-containing protein [Balneolaceae bacterium]
MFFKLLLSHLLGDFIFQSKTWVDHKERKKLKSGYLYGHFAIHAAIVQLLIQSWVITLIIVVTHAAIDIFKLLVQKSTNRRKWFFLDQFLHLVVIGVLVGWIKGFEFGTITAWTSENLLIITSIIFLTIPTSIVIKNAISRWDPDPDEDSPDSLEQAGAYIGILERLFVFTFVMSGQWNAVGFLIAAKSVFRFGDLKETHDRKLTEYILIGTLMSVGIASIVGAVVRHLL